VGRAGMHYHMCLCHVVRLASQAPETRGAVTGTWGNSRRVTRPSAS
jgi:hypothetical protein